MHAAYVGLPPTSRVHPQAMVTQGVLESMTFEASMCRLPMPCSSALREPPLPALAARWG